MLRYTSDAPQQALGFLLSQTSAIESAVWSARYPDITYPEFVPVDSSAPAWIKSVTYFSRDGAGAAKWMNGSANDFPLVGMTREKHETTVEMAGIGYDYTLEELEQARLLGMNVPADKAMIARRAYEELVEDVAYVGDTGKGFEGLLNSSAVTAADVADGAATTPEWSTKTPDEILLDVNGALTGIWTTTKTVAMADTLLLPLTQYSDIATRRLSDTSDKTILEWVEKNNIYTKVTGRPLTIRANRFLAGAGAGSTDRMVVYRKSPEVLKMHLPMRLQFMAPQLAGIRYMVPGIFRLGGVDIRLPKEVRYYDAI